MASASRIFASSTPAARMMAAVGGGSSFGTGLASRWQAPCHASGFATSTAGPLAGKVCVVTGGSAGIGAAIVSALHADGAQVIAAARDDAKLQAAAASVGTRVLGLSCDVTDEAAVVRLFAEVARRYDGQLDLLVNCAGVMNNNDPSEISAEEFSAVLAVNVVGPFICSREALQVMRARGCGRILNVGSIASLSPRPHSAPYSVSKAALSMLTKTLSIDARDQGISVGAIHPGNVLTEMVSEAEYRRRTGADGSGGVDEGFLTPQHVAEAVMCAAR